MAFVYILRSLRDGRLYTGSTTDLSRRLREHAAGHSRSTRHRRPLVLVYFEEYESLGTARVREKELKHPTAGKRKDAMIAAFPPEELAKYRGSTIGRGASA